MRLPFAQVHFKQLVSLLAHRVGKVVIAVWMLDQQILRPAVELVDLRRGGGGYCRTRARASGNRLSDTSNSTGF